MTIIDLLSAFLLQNASDRVTILSHPRCDLHYMSVKSFALAFFREEEQRGYLEIIGGDSLQELTQKFMVAFIIFCAKQS